MIDRPFARFKQPGILYDVWHVCYCDKCKSRESRGRVWTHSQADWNQHLRYVDADKIATFPTIKRESEK